MLTTGCRSEAEVLVKSGPATDERVSYSDSQGGIRASLRLVVEWKSVDPGIASPLFVQFRLSWSWFLVGESRSGRPN